MYSYIGGEEQENRTELVTLLAESCR